MILVMAWSLGQPEKWAAEACRGENGLRDGCDPNRRYPWHMHSGCELERKIQVSRLDGHGRREGYWTDNRRKEGWTRGKGQPQNWRTSHANEGHAVRQLLWPTRVCRSWLCKVIRTFAGAPLSEWWSLGGDLPWSLHPCFVRLWKLSTHLSQTEPVQQRSRRCTGS